MYGLFKQANMGDNTASSPWLPGEAKMKWAAWEACKGKTKEEAMTEYIAELERQKVRACPPSPSPAPPRLRRALPSSPASHPLPKVLDRPLCESAEADVFAGRVAGGVRLKSRV